jgi:hypothetical protein
MLAVMENAAMARPMKGTFASVLWLMVYINGIFTRFLG